MRVLWTHNFNPSNPNAGCFMHTSAKGLRALGVDVQFEFLGNLRSPWNVLAARKRIRLRARDFDVVHAQYGSACAFVTAGVDDRPTAVTVRGNDWNLHNETFHPLYFHTRLARALTRRSLGLFSAVIPVSQRLANELVNLVPTSKIKVIPAAIDLDRWKDVYLLGERNRKNTVISKTCSVLFTNSRMKDPIKRSALCNLTIAIAKKRMTGITLKVASTIPYEDMPRYVSSCDAILCVSESEGWPNSVKEALACNVPFVATDISDLQAIAAQEPTCRVCEPSATVLANNLCEVLEMARPTTLRKYVEQMGLVPSSKNLLSVYQSLVDC